MILYKIKKKKISIQTISIQNSIQKLVYKNYDFKQNFYFFQINFFFIYRK